MLRYEWNQIPWPRLEVSVFKLQKRIYRASQCGNVKSLHRLQRLLLNSRSARLLAVRRVTQDNQGRKTAGIDGVKNLTQKERLQLADTLSLKEQKSTPVRRIWVPKPGKTEKRPLGIPTMKERARQALIKMTLEPEWEAKFGPNSYGFRPGRSCHDACEALFISLRMKPAFVLDADISGCFDNIEHEPLLKKLNTTATIKKLIKSWSKAGALEGSVFHATERGTPQGSIISPLLANVALHGLEQDTKEALADELFQYEKVRTGKASHRKAQQALSIIFYADDFVVLHRSKDIVLKAKAFIEEWLKNVGLELKDSKTRITHTLETLGEDKAGFDFLGFTVRHYSDKRSEKGHKLLIKPSRESEKRHANAIGKSLKNYGVPLKRQ